MSTERFVGACLHIAQQSNFFLRQSDSFRGGLQDYRPRSLQPDYDPDPCLPFHIRHADPHSLPEHNSPRHL